MKIAPKIAKIFLGGSAPQPHRKMLLNFQNIILVIEIIKYIFQEDDVGEVWAAEPSTKRFRIVTQFLKILA